MANAMTGKRKKSFRREVDCTCKHFCGSAQYPVQPIVPLSNEAVSRQVTFKIANLSTLQVTRLLLMSGGFAFENYSEP